MLMFIYSYFYNFSWLVGFSMAVAHGSTWQQQHIKPA
jgi:hypothetical protein